MLLRILLLLVWQAVHLIWWLIRYLALAAVLIYALFAAFGGLYHLLLILVLIWLYWLRDYLLVMLKAMLLAKRYQGRFVTVLVARGISHLVDAKHLADVFDDAFQHVISQLGKPWLRPYIVVPALSDSKFASYNTASSLPGTVVLRVPSDEDLSDLQETARHELVHLRRGWTTWKINSPACVEEGLAEAIAGTYRGKPVDLHALALLLEGWTVQPLFAGRNNLSSFWLRIAALFIIWQLHEFSAETVRLGNFPAICVGYIVWRHGSGVHTALWEDAL
ncbi:MAG: hypothetical protein HPY54_13410 [Chthonomonadetes bacterium]|nr:hypothetical protein [Chthonomonadetes bacterium]